MSATAPLDYEIEVYASFPRVVALGPDLDLDPSNWHWVHCLTLPLNTLKELQFTPMPFKWIRYAIGIVVGAEGDLSTCHDSLNVVDYNAGLPDESVVLYYHISDEEKRRMFPVGPDIGHSNVTSSVATIRRAQFRDEVVERDGKCVLTRAEEIVCDAAHLLAHSKGDAYIATYTRRRSRNPTRGDIVQDIDSVKNGLLLNKNTHFGLGKHVAFLMTPNFAMNTTDIDPTAPPAEKRYSTHLFKPDTPSFLGLGIVGALPSGSPLWISDSPDWPPAILFDTVYAGAVLYYFGTQALVDEFTASWKDSYYPSGAMTVANTEHKAITDERAAVARRTENQVQGHQARFDARNGPDAFDILLALPYILVPPNEQQAMWREAKGKAEEKEQRRVQEKVDDWKKQITNA